MRMTLIAAFAMATIQCVSIDKMAVKQPAKVPNPVADL
jgi:hypothetical protein